MTIFSQRIIRFAKRPDLFKQLGRGIERETLRVNGDGYLSQQAHPIALGSALSHQWITTDFSEQLLEFITPVSFSASETIAQLDDIHRFTYKSLGDEYLWPFSMPCYIGDESEIQLADYGSSNVGRMKRLYRQGLKLRYGSKMQVIAGLHFNFSFSPEFWQLVYPKATAETLTAHISEGYFAAIRNYYRFGWLLPYFFGASPAISSSFLDEHAPDFDFSTLADGTLYLPYATSLRLSDLGYTNRAQSQLKIGFNSLEQYLDDLARAIRTPSDEFEALGVRDERGYLQLNTNVLQIENELYAPIRPKRVAQSGEKPSEALARAGVEYIEIRSLDINPYHPSGISADQVAFLDLFVTWCALTDSDPMTNCELECWRSNWRKVVLEGRKPDLVLQIGCEGEQLTLKNWGKRVFAELAELAQVMDAGVGGDRYQTVCRELETWLDAPEKTYSATVLRDLKAKGGYLAMGTELAKAHKSKTLAGSPVEEAISLQAFHLECEASIARQKTIEAEDRVSFDQYLADYFTEIV